MDFKGRIGFSFAMLLLLCLTAQAQPTPPNPPVPPTPPAVKDMRSAEQKAAPNQAMPKLKEKPSAGPAIDPPKLSPVMPMEPKLSKQQEQTLIRESCSLDYGLHCFGTPYGEGRILACLYKNAMKLTQGCSAAIKALKPR